MLLNNAGVFLDKGKPESTRDDMVNTFEINSVAPIMLTRVSSFYQVILDKTSNFINNHSLFAGIYSVAEKGVRI